MNKLAQYNAEFPDPYGATIPEWHHALRTFRKEMHDHYQRQFDAALAAAPTPPACKMRNGHGLIGGFVSGEEGYHSEPCPDCNTPPAQEAEVCVESVRGDLAICRFRGMNEVNPGDSLYTHPANDVLRQAAEELCDANDIGAFGTALVKLRAALSKK